MDKGGIRETVREIVNTEWIGNDNSCDAVISHLRSHGWHHEDDVVERKTVEVRCTHFGKGHIDGECSDLFPDECAKWIDPPCHKLRPATVGDLIK